MGRVLGAVDLAGGLDGRGVLLGAVVAIGLGLGVGAGGGLLGAVAMDVALGDLGGSLGVSVPNTIAAPTRLKTATSATTTRVIASRDHRRHGGAAWPPGAWAREGR